MLCVLWWEAAAQISNSHGLSAQAMAEVFVMHALTEFLFNVFFRRKLQSNTTKYVLILRCKSKKITSSEARTSVTAYWLSFSVNQLLWDTGADGRLQHFNATLQQGWAGSHLQHPNVQKSEKISNNAFP